MSETITNTPDVHAETAAMSETEERQARINAVYEALEAPKTAPAEQLHILNDVGAVQDALSDVRGMNRKPGIPDALVSKRDWSDTADQHQEKQVERVQKVQARLEKRLDTLYRREDIATHNLMLDAKDILDNPSQNLTAALYKDDITKNALANAFDSRFNESTAYRGEQAQEEDRADFIEAAMSGALEGELQDNAIDVSSLHEQTAERTANRDEQNRLTREAKNNFYKSFAKEDASHESGDAEDIKSPDETNKPSDFVESDVIGESTDNQPVSNDEIVDAVVVNDNLDVPEWVKSSDNASDEEAAVAPVAVSEIGLFDDHAEDVDDAPQAPTHTAVRPPNATSVNASESQANTEEEPTGRFSRLFTKAKKAFEATDGRWDEQSQEVNIQALDDEDYWQDPYEKFFGKAIAVAEFSMPTTRSAQEQDESRVAGSEKGRIRKVVVSKIAGMWATRELSPEEQNEKDTQTATPEEVRRKKLRDLAQKAPRAIVNAYHTSTHEDVRPAKNTPTQRPTSSFDAVEPLTADDFKQ